MIESLVRTALQQRLVVVVVAVVLMVFGLNAARKLSVDAFPDVTNVQVQIATEAKGRSPEEVERFVTVPLEISMTGLPGLEEMRSLNKPGLSLITLVFTDATDVYFARQLVMERLLEVGSRMPEGIVPVLGPVSTGLGEVYQYTLDHPDDGDRQLTLAAGLYKLLELEGADMERVVFVHHVGQLDVGRRRGRSRKNQKKKNYR